MAGRPDMSVPGVSLAAPRTKTTPIPVQRTRRNLDIRNLTSLPAGKMVPLVAFGLLREDKVETSRFRFNFEMQETVEILMNAVNVNLKAYLVPHLAHDRFTGIDSLNRSYAGLKETDNPATQVVPYFMTTTMVTDGSNAIYKYLGKHVKAGAVYNVAYTEAYNRIWNFRASNRSPDIAPRLASDMTLAKAFWVHQRYAHIVPDFDQAIIDGEVPLNVVNSKIPVKGFGVVSAQSGAAQDATAIYSGEAAGVLRHGWQIRGPGAVTLGTTVGFIQSQASPASPDIWAELKEDGITVSLSNIELARKTQAFAALRKQYTGHSDDYIIDLLMNGIEVPEVAWRQPMLLAERSTIFGMNKRYASDAADLTASVVNGATFVDMTIRTPRCPVGGVVMIVAEIMPEQLFERQQDAYVFTANPVTDLPEFLRDTLDPEKVEIVKNEYIDVSHATPTGTFGYAPLNHKWNAMPPGIGGKFFRPTPDGAFDEDRQRIWAVETVNPTLSEDFYLCTNMHTKPFVVTNEDPFEGVTRGLVSISGNTVFGSLLIEATDDYDQVMEEAPPDRINKP